MSRTPTPPPAAKRPPAPKRVPSTGVHRTFSGVPKVPRAPSRDPQHRAATHDTENYDGRAAADREAATAGEARHDSHTENGASETHQEEARADQSSSQPAAQEAHPKAEEPKPKEEPKPAAQEAQPKAEEQKPAAQEAQPKAEEQKPAAQESQPKAEEQKPAAQEAQPKAEEQKPAAQESQPKAEEQKPAAQEAQPKAEEQKPAAQEAQPKAEEQKPAAQESQPKAQDSKTSKDEGPSSDRRPSRATLPPPHKHSAENPDRSRHFIELDETPKAPTLQVSSRKTRPASPAPAPPETSSTTPGTPASRIEAMFRCYCPYKLAELHSVLTEFQGREETLLQALVIAYGPEPAAALAGTEPRGANRAGNGQEGADSRSSQPPVAVLHSLSQPPTRLPEPGPSQTDSSPPQTERPHADSHAGGSGRGYRAFYQNSPKGRTTPNREPQATSAHYATTAPARTSSQRVMTPVSRHSPSRRPATPTAQPGVSYVVSREDQLLAAVRRRLGVQTPSMVGVFSGVARETIAAPPRGDVMEDSLASYDVHHSRTSSESLYPYPHTHSMYVFNTSSARSPSPYRPTPNQQPRPSVHALEVHNRRAHPPHSLRL